MNNNSTFEIISALTISLIIVLKIAYDAIKIYTSSQPEELSPIIHHGPRDGSDYQETGKSIKRKLYSILPTKINGKYIWLKYYFSYEKEFSRTLFDDSVMGGSFPYEDSYFSILKLDLN